CVLGGPRQRCVSLAHRHCRVGPRRCELRADVGCACARRRNQRMARRPAPDSVAVLSRNRSAGTLFVTGFANLAYLDTRASFFARNPVETTRFTGFNDAHSYGMRYEVSTQSPMA